MNAVSALGRVELAPSERSTPAAAVVLREPAFHAIPAAGPDLSTLRFGFEVETGWPALCAIAMAVWFDHPGVRAHDLRVTAPEAGADTAVWTTEDGVIGCLLGDPLGRSPAPRTGELAVIVRLPDELDRISGRIRLHGTVRRGLVRAKPLHLSATQALGFETEPLDRPASARPAQAPVRSMPVGVQPAVRLCVAVDTEQYSRFAVPEAARAQQRFVRLLATARRRAGIDEADVHLQQSGDGQFMVLPVGVDESVVIPALVEGFRAGLAEVNHDLSEHARLRLRVAMHRGHVAPGSNGWLGNSVIAVHRMLDSEVLRQALAAQPSCDFALLVSDVLYRDVIADGYGPLTPERYSAVTAVVPAKRFAEPAWLYLPDG